MEYANPRTLILDATVYFILLQDLRLLLGIRYVSYHISRDCQKYFDPFAIKEVATRVIESYDAR